jgi:hypothetical protein
MRQPASLLQGLEQAGILAVLRPPSAEHALRAVDALPRTSRQAATDHDRWT